MIGDKKLIAIIPARGGSKRLPNKNILDLEGKPLIAWSIIAAQQSEYVDRLIVSTDDKEISAVALEYGAEVPFIRPFELSDDNSTTVDVIEHAIKKLEGEGDYYEYVLILQPTSPLRTVKHINEAVLQLINTSADAIVSVSEVEHPTEWCNTLPDNYSLKGFINNEYLGVRSQDFPKRYCLNGAVYVVKTDRFVKEKSLFLREKSFAYVMERFSSIDIDTMEDFLCASSLMRFRRECGSEY